jgi:hypothetical protein
VLFYSSVNSPIVILSQTDTLDLAYQFERNKLFTYKESVTLWISFLLHGAETSDTSRCNTVNFSVMARLGRNLFHMYDITDINWGTLNNSVRSWCLIVTINCRFIFGTYVVRMPTRFLAVVNDILFSTRFEARSPNCEKRLRAASCLSVCLSAWNDSAPTWRIFMIFYIWIFFENMSS